MLSNLQGYKVHFYPYTFQKIDSNLCGYFAIFISKMLNSMMSDNENITPNQITRQIYKLFGNSADDKDEELLFTRKNL